MVFFTKYLFLGSFFSFNAAASVDYIYLQAGRVRPGGGGGVKANLIFLSWGLWGVQNKLEQKSRGVKANFFYITFIWIIFFLNVRVRQEGG